MYSEGVGDLMDLVIMYPFTPPENKQKHLSNIQQKAKDRFLPVFEKVLTVTLLEVTLLSPVFKHDYPHWT